MCFTIFIFIFHINKTECDTFLFISYTKIFLLERILDRINILQFLLFFRLQMYIINVEAMNVKDFSVVVIHNFK